MNIRRYMNAALARSHAVSLGVLFGLLLLLVAAPAAGVTAQDASTAGHPMVGTWALNTSNGGLAVASFTSDGIVIDHESVGDAGLGTWTATSATQGNVTFVIFVNKAMAGIDGTLVIRATVDYDEASDSLSGNYSLTAAGFDGSVLFTEEGSITGTRLAAETPDMVGSPVPSLLTGTPAAG